MYKTHEDSLVILLWWAEMYS